MKVTPGGAAKIPATGRHCLGMGWRETLSLPRMGAPRAKRRILILMGTRRQEGSQIVMVTPGNVSPRNVPSPSQWPSLPPSQPPSLASLHSWQCRDLNLPSLTDAPRLAPCAQTAGSGTAGNATTSPRAKGTGPTAGATALSSVLPWLGSTPCGSWLSCCATKANPTTGSASGRTRGSSGNGPTAPNSTTCSGSEEAATARI